MKKVGVDNQKHGCRASKKMVKSKIKAYNKQWNLQDIELHGVDLCRHHHHRKMMDDKERHLLTFAKTSKRFG